MRVLLVDNRDSFTFNLLQLIAGVTGSVPDVLAHDDPSWRPERLGRYDAVVISPGPGHPSRAADLGHSAAILQAATVPVLGVCLGMQAMCRLEGGEVVLAPEPVHGRVDPIEHGGTDLFAGLPNPLSAVRYHSWVCELPESFEVTAWTHDGLAMACRHRERPWWGVQFHPESICSEGGEALIAAFFRHVSGTSPVSAPTLASPVAGVCPEVAWERVGSGIDTEAAYHALFADSPCSVWLDGAATELGARFSLLGDAEHPGSQWVSHRVGQGVRVGTAAGEHTVAVTIWDWLREQLGRPGPGGPPVPFQLGYVGYLGYELGAPGTTAVHRSEVPDAQLLLPGRALVVEHHTDQVYALWLRSAGAVDGVDWFERVRALLAELPSAPAPAPEVVRPPPVTARHDLRAYADLVRACKHALLHGESYELCLTNELEVQAQLDPVRLFCLLRRSNPAPYAALLRFGEVAVVSSSPERFLRLSPDGAAEAKPIKGTARRDPDPSVDEVLRESLRTSPKDRAENLMITDLLRNDLGRVCEVGSVHVPRLFEVESFATVHQLVSTVRGRLRHDVHPVEAVRVCFPGGSMTGAPKVRSLAILASLEGGPRGIYSGALGYFSLSGDIDLSIVIRSVVCTVERTTVGVGGAVVAQSDPLRETEEMLLKAEALLEAISRSGWRRRTALDVSA